MLRNNQSGISHSNRRRQLKSISEQYENFTYKVWAVPLFRIASAIMCDFKTTVTFDAPPPTDGGVIFVFNHQNIYDSMVQNYALKKYPFTCLSEDSPRGTFTGLVFESMGATWVNRSDPNSRADSAQTLCAVLRDGLSIGWCPEGTWNTSENRLMLPLAHGMARVAIEAAKTSKVYMVPVMTDYQYKENLYKVKRASVRVCKAIPVSPDMHPKELTETVETVCWTTRWEQMEARMRQTPGCKKCGEAYLYPREKVSREKWKWFVDKLHRQYKTDWTVEESYRIVTPEERLQMEMQKYINPTYYH